MTPTCRTHRLDEPDYCVVDLETTGFSPTQDAIVEIAAVRIRPDGEIVDQFSSLVNPGRPMAGTQVHGLTDADVKGAPALDELSGHLARCLHGAVLASYNIYFDFPFLQRTWLQPLGVEADVPRLCCMYLRGMVGLEPSRMTLAAALAELKLAPGRSHTALADADGTARLLAAYLVHAQDQGIHTFDALAKRKAYKFVSSWEAPLVALPTNLPAHAVVVRPPKVAPEDRGPIPLRRSVERVWDGFVEEPPAGAEEYLACLCDALSDRVLTADEMAALVDAARFYELAPKQVTDLHHRLFEAVVAEADAEGGRSGAEAADIDALRRLLGVTEAPRGRGAGWGWRLLLVLVVLLMAAAVVLGWLG